MKQYKSNDNQIVLNVNIGIMMTGKLLEGRTVLITGASGGIGACIAKQCVEQNANVILIGRNQKRLEDNSNNTFSGNFYWFLFYSWQC